MSYNPNHPVHCPCPQCSWWSLGLGEPSSAQCVGSLFSPPHTRIFTPAPAATQTRINLDVCSPRLWFCFIGNSEVESRASASRNFAPAGARNSGMEGWV